MASATRRSYRFSNAERQSEQLLGALPNGLLN
jgi:hypothetical protein